MEGQQVTFALADLEQAIAQAMTAGLKPLIEELKADPPRRAVHGTFKAESPIGVLGRKNLRALKRSELKTSELISEFVRAVYRSDLERIVELGGAPLGEARDLLENTGATGGFLVPAEFRAEVVTKLEKFPYIWNRALHIPCASDKLEMPSETGSVVWSWTAESATITASNPTLGQVVFSINFLAGLTKTSRQLLADSRIDIGDFLSYLYARELGKELDKQFMTGDGSGKPLGIRNSGVTNTVAQAGANLAYADIVSLWHALPSQYRANAVWLAHDSRFSLVERLADSTGRPIFVQPGQALQTIYSRPILEQQDIPTNLGGGANESEIWLGDLNYYGIADREEMGLEISTQAGTSFETHQAWFKLWTRIDGRVMLKDAFAYLSAVK